MAESDAQCLRFISKIRDYFEVTLEAHQFVLTECSCMRGGRECVAMYEAPFVRLLVVLSDGSVSVLLGATVAAFPGPNYVDPMGRTGWYMLSLLSELKSEKRVWTEERLQQFWRGELDAYRFEAELFAEWADRLLPLFEPNHDQSWREEFHRRFRV
ncbi:MAG: hypothetical protein WAZ19_08170 [Anaerolineae bacterium]